ncbi:MAG: hypothetical protein AAF542_07360 [Pseudomonadota bacterium]
MLAIYFVLIFAAVSTQHVYASDVEPSDIPISFDEALAGLNSWRIDFGSTIGLSSARQLSTLSSVVELNDGEMFDIPFTFEESSDNETVDLFLGVRYGVGAKTELYAIVNGRHQTSRGTIADFPFSSSASGLSTLRLGVNRELIPVGHNHPAVLMFIETLALENVATEGHRFVSGKSWVAGLTVYQSADPLIFATSLSYSIRRQKQTSIGFLDEPEVLSLSPSLVFLPNHTTSLTLGVSLSHRFDSFLDERKIASPRTDYSLQLGASYIFSESLFVDVTTNIRFTGEGASQFGFRIVRTI